MARLWWDVVHKVYICCFSGLECIHGIVSRREKELGCFVFGHGDGVMVSREYVYNVSEDVRLWLKECLTGCGDCSFLAECWYLGLTVYPYLADAGDQSCKCWW